ncbi:MAG: type II toxin-antitoxin system death-on-curing family toxin [Planctomycetes bacterium]|nr:type II toxin-antitoxin system death-on-curing family toxin [Planctomycetota bacterium]
MPPVFLELTEILEIHRDQIERYGGSSGIRDMNLLQSAVAMPQASFGGQFLHEFPFAMAAAYLFHLVQNHPFIDGNKRVGAVAAIVFLVINGIELAADEDEFEKLVLKVAQGQADKAAITAFLRENAKPPRRPSS